MKKIHASLQLASHNVTTGDTLYTFVLTYPRIILPEVLTHRAFSRNTASSRAIPAKVIRKQVWDDPFVPRFIGKNQKGMQAETPVSPFTHSWMRRIWRMARIPACFFHWVGADVLGVHKQIVNRILEPWMWVEQVVSFTEFENFRKQRCHKDAEPHFELMAEMMAAVVDATEAMLPQMKQYSIKTVTGEEVAVYDPLMATFFNKIQLLEPGEWHLPFAEDYSQTETQTGKVVSAARCARVSYNLMNGQRSTWEEDQKIFDKLSGSDPKHLSPFEHPAKATAGFWGNYKGFRQLRYELEAHYEPSVEEPEPEVELV
jgi:hypothetical protein